jgi:NAD(P)-dependent dehydrogenase (short-subunit alcohol dehydrogenase family)
MFVGQSVIVTGGARGLGRGIAAAFGNAGASVVACDVNAERLKTTVDELNAEIQHNAQAAGDGKPVGTVEAVEADVSDGADVARLIDYTMDRFGRIDHLVNNAGIVTIAPLVDTTDADWDRVLAVNLKGTFLTTRAVLKPMLAAQSGSIVNIASQAGKRPNRFIAPYNASKAAVISLTRTAAVEAAPHVRVNCVCPGFINTELQEEEYDVVSGLTGQSKEDIRRSWLDSMPLGRFQEVDDVASCVLFLASPAASQTTGEALNISGGLVME